MQFVDFFAGIGGIRLGLEQAGHKCVGFCEFDKYARTAYKAMYDTEGEWENHDVRTVKPYDVPAADLWCFGFPCQDISVAGKQKGLQEGERSGLFYEIMRLLAGRRKEDRPKWLLIENVKNLLSIGNGFDFARLLVEVGGYGYSLEWQLINSKDYGVPQNRERVFIVGYLGDIRGREVFPLRPTDGENPCKLNEITQGVADAQRIYDGSGLARTLKGESGGQGGKTGLYAVKVLKPYGSTGGVCGLKIAENKIGIASTCVARDYTRDYKGISRHNGNAVAILRKERNEYGKSIRKDYEAGKVAESRHNMTQYACRKDGISNTLTTVQKDNLLMSVYDEQNNTLRTDGTDKALKVIDAYNKRELKGGIVGTLTASGNTSIGHCGTFLVADYNDSNIQTDSNSPKVIGGVGEKTFGKQYPQGNRIYDVGHVSPALQANNGNASKGSIIIGGKNIRIRRLTPREVWRLQGFPDEYFDKARAAGISDTQLYKQAGNGVTVNVARAIGERLKEVEEHGC